MTPHQAMEILGIDNTDDRVVRKAYLKQSLIYHPDKWSYKRTRMEKEDGKNYFIQIYAANQLLTNL